MTTNGTLVSPAALDIYLMPDLDLTISCDGSTAAHDKHRRFANGDGSAAIVHQTIRERVAAGKDFQALVVVRPAITNPPG